MDVFVIGATGDVGRLLVPRLRSRGDVVRGLVARADQQAELAARGVDTHLGDLATMGVAELTVLPPADRQQGPDDVEYHYAVTEEADIELSRTDLSWLMLRPEALVDPRRSGPVPREPVDEAERSRHAAVATALADLLRRPGAHRRVPDHDRRAAPVPRPVRATACAP